MGYRVETKVSWAQIQTELEDEFRKWGVRDWITNYPRGARKSGLNQSEGDRTVTLTYTKNGKQINLSMGKQSRAVDNLRVLYLAINAMRMNETRGLSEVFQSAYAQLGSGQAEKTPYEILGLMENVGLDIAEAAYRARMKSAHPDFGGSAQMANELNRAIQAIREEKDAKKM